MDRKAHWEDVYATKAPNTVSWYQVMPARSIELIAAVGADSTTPLIDVGGGDSTLVDALLERQIGPVTVLDLSGAALRRASARLGRRAGEVAWLEADVTRAELPTGGFGIWHDRAVFHFLTDAEDRARYVQVAANAVRSGGTLIVATFADDGPERCSGLSVARYTPEALGAVFTPRFTPVRGFGDVHTTPGGAEQRFSWAVLVRD